MVNGEFANLFTHYSRKQFHFFVTVLLSGPAKKFLVTEMARFAEMAVSGSFTMGLRNLNETRFSVVSLTAISAKSSYLAHFEGNVYLGKVDYVDKVRKALL